MYIYLKRRPRFFRQYWRDLASGRDVDVKDDVKSGVLCPYMDTPRHFDAIFTSSLTFTS